MIKLYDKGVYLVNGREIIEDTMDVHLAVKEKTGIDNIRGRSKEYYGL